MFRARVYQKRPDSSVESQKLIWSRSADVVLLARHDMTDMRGLRPVSRDSVAACGPRCARLCTDEGLAAVLDADQGLLHWRAARRLGGDSGLAEHAVQETLLRAWRGCATYDPDKGSVRTWLLTIERNVLTDIARMRAVRPAETSWDELVDADTRSAGPDFADALTDGLLVAQLLAGLPAAQRDAVEQVILRDRAYQDVAADLGVPVGTVKTRVHYALRSLRRLPLGA